MIKILKYTGMLTLLVAVFKLGCPFLKILGITCPACGVTHAWISFLSGDVSGAFRCNPFFLPLTGMFLRIIYCDIKKCALKHIEFICYCILTISAVIFNFFRIFNGL